MEPAERRKVRGSGAYFQSSNKEAIESAAFMGALSDVWSVVERKNSAARRLRRELAREALAREQEAENADEA